MCGPPTKESTNFEMKMTTQLIYFCWQWPSKNFASNILWVCVWNKEYLSVFPFSIPLKKYPHKWSDTLICRLALFDVSFIWSRSLFENTKTSKNMQISWLEKQMIRVPNYFFVAMTNRPDKTQGIWNLWFTHSSKNLTNTLKKELFAFSQRNVYSL